MGRRVTLWRELDFFFKRSLLAALECGLEGSIQARDGLESFAVVQGGDDGFWMVSVKMEINKF